MRKILKATKALFMFKPYTIYPRWMEIGYGLMVWFLSLIILYAWLK